MTASAVPLSPHWGSLEGRGTWRPGDVSLRQRLGEVTLGRLSFRGAIYTHDFATTPTLSRELDELPFPEFPAGWDAIAIPSAPVEVAPAPLRIGRRAIRYVPHVYRRHYIRLDRFATFDEYLAAAFSGKSRHNLRRQMRGFPDGESGAAFTVYRTADEMAEFHRLASGISARTYQTRLIGAGLDGGDAKRAELCAGARQDAFRGYLLCDGPTPVAFGLCERVGSWLVYDKTGYDPAFAGRSPGTVLLCRMIDSAIAERQFQGFDFAEGDAWYKERFASDSRLCADVFFVRPTLRGALGVLANRGLALASKCAARSLEILRLKQRVKALLRRGEA